VRVGPIREEEGSEGEDTKGEDVARTGDEGGGEEERSGAEEEGYCCSERGMFCRFTF